MATREKSLYAWLRRGAEGYGKNAHLTRVENSACSGAPDVEGCILGKQAWIELKCVDRPKRPTTPLSIRFERGQLPWLKDRWIAGGNCHVLVQVGKSQEAKRYLISGDVAENFFSRRMTEEELTVQSLVHSTASAELVIGVAFGFERL